MYFVGYLKPLLQSHPKRRLIPQEVRLLVNPIGTLRRQPKIKMKKQFGHNQTDLTIRQAYNNAS